MQKVEIRRLEQSDAADFRFIRLFALQTAPEAFGSTWEMEAPRPLSAWEDRLKIPAAFGAYENGKIVGMARFVQDTGSDKERHKGSVYGMFVAPEARARGVGSALLAALIEYASDIVEQLRLGVVDTNAEAIRLYQKHGFEIYGTEIRALKSQCGYSNEVLMALRLKDD